MNVIAIAIPYFLALMLLEMSVSFFGKKKLYRFSDTVNSLSCGIYSRLSELFLLGGMLLIYQWIDDITPGGLSLENPWIWVLCFLLVDHQYYWFHRLSHRVNLIWGSHIPHHQSEEYNLAVALRQGAFQGFFSTPFYYPLAAMGFPLEMMLICHQINLVYQFWIHTRLIKSLGPLEWFLNTPSHHRVHHGINFKYIDRNYGGVLIIWDLLYGSFQKEEEEPRYGTVKPLQSWNPIWAHVQHWVSLMKQSQQFSGSDRVKLRLKLWWKPPGWTPEIKSDLDESRALKEQLRDLDTPLGRPVFDPPVSVKTRTLVLFALFLPGIAVTLALIHQSENHLNWPPWVQVCGALFVILALYLAGRQLGQLRLNNNSNQSIELCEKPRWLR